MDMHPLPFKMGNNAIGTQGALAILDGVHNDRSVLQILDLTVSHVTIKLLKNCNFLPFNGRAAKVYT